VLEAREITEATIHVKAADPQVTRRFC